MMNKPVFFEELKIDEAQILDTILKYTTDPESINFMNSKLNEFSNL
jgi:hypothetical protein